jgi:hypothetical protein
MYVVERYVPGASRLELERALAPLGPVTEQMRAEGTRVRWLGSTIVPQDEACFCQFDGPSEAAVAEANRRARLAFDRIVGAVAVTPRVQPAHEEVLHD